MRRRPGLCSLLALVTFSCVRPLPPTAAPSPAAVHTIAVLPPNNRTGDPLLVAGASFFEQYVAHTERVTVPDLLAAEARLQLTRRGFTVAAPETVEAATCDQPPADSQQAAAVATRNQIAGSVMYIDLRRWEADAPSHPHFVIASLEVVLIEPSSGHVLWRVDHPSRPVPTRGVVNLGDAYVIAAHTVIDEMFGGLGPEAQGDAPK